MENSNLCLTGAESMMGSLISMLNYTRSVTVSIVQGLDIRMLEHLHDEKSNSIAMLLMHIASVEKWFQVMTFENRNGFNAEEEKIFGPGFELDRKLLTCLKGNDLNYYLDLMEKIRGKTIAELKQRDDNWLMERIHVWKNVPSDKYFCWFHVMEDEINHRGQISWLKKRLPG